MKHLIFLMKYLSGINLMCILRTPNKKNTKKCNATILKNYGR